jgi:hypothetical protein
MEAMTRDEALALIRKATADGELRIADNTQMRRVSSVIVHIFLGEVFGIRGAMLTDESSLWDFASTPDAIMTKFDADPDYKVTEQDRADWDPLWRKETVSKAQEIFGVDIDPVFDEPLFVVMQHIAAKVLPDAALLKA